MVKTDKTCQYYYHPVINSMKYFNTNNDNPKKITILNVDQFEKENDISNREFSQPDILDEAYNNKDGNDTVGDEYMIRIADLPKRPRPPSYEDKILSLKRSLERRQRKMQDSHQRIVNTADIVPSINSNESNINKYV